MSVYKNGNTIVEIQEDGTKIRYVPDNVPALPLYPESIDMKITNKCDLGCLMCHEQSIPNGIHGNLNHPIINSLHPYTEVAIGGGDPMGHPDIEKFLKKLKEKNVIANITVHWRSFDANFDTLIKWAADGLVHGIGVSVNEQIPCGIAQKLSVIRNVVVHTIMGVANDAVYHQMANRNLNILLLGYKTFGRGIMYRTDNSIEIAKNIAWVQKHINEFPEYFRAVSFDNLAIEQTGITNKLNPELFEQIYMGGDGSFTMYVDLVENKYAISSTSERHTIDCNTIDELFAMVRKKAGYATTG